MIIRGTEDAGAPDRILLDANNANLWMGGSGKDGDIVLFPARVKHGVDLTKASIHLNGDTGDVAAASFTPTGADCAENFDVDDQELAGPGTVMVIGEDGRLRASDQAYDRRVAGVVAGKGDNRPGIILGSRIGGGSPRAPIALMGRVFCKVDADQASIDVGGT